MRRNKKLLILTTVLLAVFYLVQAIIPRIGAINSKSNTDESVDYATVDWDTNSTTSVNGKMSVTFVDVDQGDCAIIKQGDEVMMIDTGKYSEYDNVQEEMADEGIREIDTLVLTHPDADHIGGAEDLIEDCSVEEVVMPDCTSDSKTYDRLMDAIEDNNTKVTHPNAGDTIFCGEAIATVVGPVHLVDDTNSCSIVLRLIYGTTSFLFTGDATGAETDDIILNQAALSSDVIKVSHHGSAQDGCNNTTFLNKVNPKYAIISVGYDNSYGHPHEETMEYLKARGISMFRTDLQGTIKCISDGVNYSWMPTNCMDFSSGN